HIWASPIFRSALGTRPPSGAFLLPRRFCRSPISAYVSPHRWYRGKPHSTCLSSEQWMPSVFTSQFALALSVIEPVKNFFSPNSDLPVNRQRFQVTGLNHAVNHLLRQLQKNRRFFYGIAWLVQTNLHRLFFYRRSLLWSAFSFHCFSRLWFHRL